MALYAEYVFDTATGVIADRSGNGHPLTVTNPSGGSVVPGRTGGVALEVSGSVFGAATPPPAALANVSFQFWARNTDTANATNAVCGFVNTTSPATMVGYLTRNLSGQRTPQVTYRTVQGGNTYRQAGDLTGVPDGNWHNYAVLFDGADSPTLFGGAAIYRDGVRVGLNVLQGETALYTTTRFLIGPDNIMGGPSNFVIEDLRIFDHTLSDQEIIDWMNTPVDQGGGGPVPHIGPTPVQAYSLGEAHVAKSFLGEAQVL